MLRVCSVSFASNSWPSADAGHSKRRCWAKFWTAADAENAHSGVGLPACGSLAPLRKVYVVWFRQRTGRLALLRGLYGPYTPKPEEPVSLTSAYMPAIRLICAVRLAGVSG